MATSSGRVDQSGDELPLHPARPRADATAISARTTAIDPEHTLPTKAAEDVRDLHDAQDYSSQPPSNVSSASFRSSPPDSPSLSPSASPAASSEQASRASEGQPPLPKNVQTLVDTIACLFDGQTLHQQEGGGDDGALIHFPLHPDEWPVLLAALQRPGFEHLGAFVEDRLRYDFFADQHLFVIRMPGPTHESVNGKIVRYILRSLDRLAGQGESSTAETTNSTAPRQISAPDFAALVEPQGSFRMSFNLDPDGPTSQHEPDASFGLDSAGSEYPGVVLEVSYSQKPKQLAKLAYGYLLDTPGPLIQVVITLDLSYPTGDDATLSVWRRHVEPARTETEKPEVDVRCIKYLFRSNGLRLRTEADSVGIKLREFATLGTGPNVEHLEEEIQISLDDVNDWIDVALTKRRTASKAANRTTTGWESFRKRPRDSTPPEELKDDDEERFRKQEAEASQKAEEKDDDFRPARRARKDK
ncbi:hypothetical protein B0T19DRAFT_80238 [Cercophora scortea]|uniref:Uncharacterized protein n=1 Tax=Cercophora scortea TaxID=314031 RepID=A0AAE0J6V9_9PEZI|nr:hypothetical protein B0T19DRAFT_80238 [Cercophora scortea]